MIECRRHPACGRVAIVTGVTARDMQRVLTDGHDPIVAGSASTHYLRVIDRQYWRK